MELNSEDELTKQIKALEMNNFKELIHFVSCLPYGRNSNRRDFSLVLSERKGTCSSKHALLKTIADLNGINEIKLILGLYKMNTINTPGIGTELLQNNLDYLPEAHCYLQIADNRFDFTNAQSTFQTIEDSILEEIEIEPEQVGDWKIEFHKTYLKSWLKEQKISFTFDEIWEIRERCIANLSLKNNIP